MRLIFPVIKEILKTTGEAFVLIKPQFECGMELAKKYKETLGFYSCTVPTFMQYVLTELLDNGDFERHINRVRRKKRKELSQEAT